MSETPKVPALSNLDAKTQLIPVLNEAQIERVRAVGKVRRVEQGEILFRPNDTDVPFFVLLSGGMEILQPALDSKQIAATHTAGHFTGEISMISGQRCFVLGQITEAGEVIEVSNEALRGLVARDAELSEILLRAFILRRIELITRGFGNAILLGSRHSALTLQLREFLSRNRHPHNFVDLDSDRTSQDLLDRFHIQPSEIPVVVCNGETVLRRPSIQDVACCLGLNADLDGDQVYDVVIAGAGPAGLAAAVYGASEGLDVLVVETAAPGGQAGSSSKIENYLGFPTGISGMELAVRATDQAQKFGAQMVVARSVSRLFCEQHPYRLELESGETLTAKAIVIATGAQYKKPALDNLERFEGKGIYYGATYIESQLCESDEVAVVGGGNSAGQAAAFLSQTAKKVHMLVRGRELRSTMSRYLIQRLTENPQVELHYATEITALEGDDDLERLTWQDKSSGEVSTHPVRHLFIMTGASPRTEWLKGCLALDEKGFILTGRDVEDGAADHGAAHWPLNRAPQMLETSLPGVFAVGDVRAGNVKRVASAVGEGAISIHLVHQYLADS